MNPAFQSYWELSGCRVSGDPVDYARAGFEAGVRSGMRMAQSIDDECAVLDVLFGLKEERDLNPIQLGRLGEIQRQAAARQFREEEEETAAIWELNEEIAREWQTTHDAAAVRLCTLASGGTAL